jgi:hypothetical protein
LILINLINKEEKRVNSDFYMEQYGSSSAEPVMENFETFGTALLWVGIAVVSIMLLLGLLVYILQAIGLQGMAKKRNLPNAFYAWIPIANLFLLEELVGEFELFNNRITKWAKYMVIGIIAIMVLSIIPIIGSLINFFGGMAIFIFVIIVHYYLFKKYKPDLAVLYTVLAALGLGFMPIFLLRNSLPVENTGEAEVRNDLEV